eukprot:1411875-Rhodomonas_salina.1
MFATRFSSSTDMGGKADSEDRDRARSLAFIKALVRQLSACAKNGELAAERAVEYARVGPPPVLVLTADSAMRYHEADQKELESM